MDKLLILGASGFTGQHLINHINEKLTDQFDVYASDMFENSKNVVNSKYYTINANDSEALHNLIKSIRPDYIINLIGFFKNTEWKKYYETHFLITKNIMDSLLDLELRKTRLLLIGSAAEYGYPDKNPLTETDNLNPVNYYGLSKVMQTQIAQYYFNVHSIDVIIARTFNVTGKGISTSLSIGSFAKQIDEAKNGDTINVGNLETGRDFLPIEEVVRRYIVLLKHGVPGNVYNICSGKPKKIKNILLEMIKESGKNLEVVVDKSRFKKNDVENIYGNSCLYDELEKSIISMTQEK